VLLGRDLKSPQIIHALQRTYTDGLNGQAVFTYHTSITGLEAGAEFAYAVTADNDRNRARPFRATFKMAGRGRIPFRWTSDGDLATPNTAWRISSPQSAFAVRAVERFRPLFHLLNGDLCYANPNPTARPEVWADFGNNVQNSAAYRPWMPCPGNHEIEFCNGAQGFNSYLTRYSLPDNGTYFQATLQAASRDLGIDWIVVQMHQDALSSSKSGNGSDKGIREAWLPLLDRYGVDLVLCGHDHDYERSWPVRGCNRHTGRDTVSGAAVDTLQPIPA
jgi:hypothetical protein